MGFETEDDDQAVIDAADDATENDEGQHDAHGEGETPANEGADDVQDDGDEVVVSIGDEVPPSEDEQAAERAPAWVKELRKTNRVLIREKRELEAKLAAKAAPTEAQAAVVVGAKPTLEGCDYDAEQFEQKLETWHARKREADDQQRQQQAAQDAARGEWQKKLDAYGTAKTALKVQDFEDAEDAAQSTFSVVQQGVILNGAENAALMVYALGKNPKKAKELASIADPVKFAFAVAKLETQLKVTPRKSAPIPERAVRGSGSVTGVPGATSANLDKLRDEAQRTGDYSRYLDAKRRAQKPTR